MEIVAGALPSLLPKLAELLQGEYNLQKEVKGGIIFLQAELESMKVALEKISETPPNKLDKQDKIWARDVRELSYDIEDRIDMFMVRCKDGNKVTKAEQYGFKMAIDRSLNWLIRPHIRRKIAIDIRDIKRQVQEVHERRCRYDLKNNHTDHDKPVKVDPRALVRYEDVTKLVGTDEARDEVIRILIQGDEVSKQQQDKIVSIVGFGGLGKTTLANMVCEKLKEEFDCSAFVSVSQTPDMEQLFKSLWYQLSKGNNTSINNSVIIDELRKFLREKRYLIVIDDIWDVSDWKHIRCALPPNSSGCKIITTTRNMRVAEEVGGAYKMKPLCPHSSRKLFYGRIFGHEGKDKCPDEELVEVSNKILTKCAGVPLAIITIAALLACKKRSKLDWYEVYNSIGTGMENNTDVENMRNVLSLSYYNLPSHLKTCLLHLSMFPEDVEINKRRLIWMWIAEGFIVQCGKKGHGLFEVGESYFNEIVNRSLIQPVYDYYSNSMEIQSCRVHDMVLDLIRSLSSAENFITMLDYMGHTYPSQKVRRLSVQNDKVDHATDGATMTMQQVRSLVVFSSAAILIPTLPRFGVLRVLCLDICDLSNGYDLMHIGKLVHLRYLGLRSTKIVHLPKEIGNLHFLQVLDISGNEISTWPFSTVQLTQLKCLYIDRVDKINMIRGLTSLEELSYLYINDSIATVDVEALGHLTELRVLKIACCFEEELEYMLVECLNKLQNIQNLSLGFEMCWSNMDGWVGPHESLCSLKLGVAGSSLLKLPGWIKHSHLRNLSFLHMRLYEVHQEDLEIIGRLPALRDLDMDLISDKGRFDDIFREFVIGAGLFLCLVRCKLVPYDERVVFQQGAMPRLTSLELHVPNKVWSAWTEFPDLGFENLPSLQDLHLGLGHSRRSCSDVVKAALRNMAEIHPNHPSVSATGHRY